MEFSRHILTTATQLGSFVVVDSIKLKAYNLRDYVYITIQQQEPSLGNVMKARTLLQRTSGAGLSTFALNRMANFRMPECIRI